jgi:hypothetical protein
MYFLDGGSADDVGMVSEGDDDDDLDVDDDDDDDDDDNSSEDNQESNDEEEFGLDAFKAQLKINDTQKFR